MLLLNMKYHFINAQWRLSNNIIATVLNFLHFYDIHVDNNIIIMLLSKYLLLSN